METRPPTHGTEIKIPTTNTSYFVAIFSVVYIYIYIYIYDENPSPMIYTIQFSSIHQITSDFSSYHNVRINNQQLKVK